MAGTSKSTTPLTVRLRNDTLEAIKRRCDKYPGEMHPSQYIRMTMEYMVHRKHIKTRKPTKKD